ncbi:hypothetical protein FDH01_gp211 [Acinetobacter phage vB_AbaM_ME3]|uniref:Uncharacterized protein n=1 Tax=Acinetobacter phage vB_AbaM_ME3 TaxID=1837876 RepID=A0A172Q0N0_9CAUD|nr:hypothetical protein FDH01_gp211 [Acinetobacter phage vB_AbaM_ME3]AND75411.1 hypothetical protein ME3_250 [Acinetobacter phage vB_AbaM_ME3]
MNFRKEREYIIQVEAKHWIRFVCRKITKNEKGEIVSYTFFNTYSKTEQIFKVEEVEQFLRIKEPIDNSEFFTMYINWCNFVRPGIHQDIEYASTLRYKILQSLEERTHVLYGAGAFNDYDLKLSEKLRVGIYT